MRALALRHRMTPSDSNKVAADTHSLGAGFHTHNWGHEVRLAGTKKAPAASQGYNRNRHSSCSAHKSTREIPRRPASAEAHGYCAPPGCVADSCLFAALLVLCLVSSLINMVA